MARRAVDRLLQLALFGAALADGSGPSAPDAPAAVIPLKGAVGTLGVPVFGLGCRGLRPGAETENAVRWALDAGYRMFETSPSDGNEESIGRALRDSGVPRSQVFLLSRLRAEDHGYSKAHHGVRRTLQRLRVDYVDMLVQSSDRLIETWDALVEMRMMGLARSVGTAGLEVRHLKAFEAHHRQLPAATLAEVNPMNLKRRQRLIDWCTTHGIAVLARASIRPLWTEEAATDAVPRVAEAVGRTSAQVMLRWSLQMGFQVAPRTYLRQHVVENSNVFDFRLSEGEMAKLSELSVAADVRLSQEGEEDGEAEDLGDTNFSGPGARSEARRGERLDL